MPACADSSAREGGPASTSPRELDCLQVEVIEEVEEVGEDSKDAKGVALAAGMPREAVDKKEDIVSDLVTTSAPSQIHPAPSLRETEPEKLDSRPPRSRNPISWYGILASPTLRSAQSHFVAIFASPEKAQSIKEGALGGGLGLIDTLVNVGLQMQAVEVEVCKVRKALRL